MQELLHPGQAQVAFVVAQQPNGKQCLDHLDKDSNGRGRLVATHRLVHLVEPVGRFDGIDHWGHTSCQPVPALLVAFTLVAPLVPIDRDPAHPAGHQPPPDRVAQVPACGTGQPLDSPAKR